MQKTMATLQWRGAVGEIYSILTALILHRNLDELLKSRPSPLPFSREEVYSGLTSVFRAFPIWPHAKQQPF